MASSTGATTGQRSVVVSRASATPSSRPAMPTTRNCCPVKVPARPTRAAVPRTSRKPASTQASRSGRTSAPGRPAHARLGRSSHAPAQQAARGHRGWPAAGPARRRPRSPGWWSSGRRSARSGGSRGRRPHPPGAGPSKGAPGPLIRNSRLVSGATTAARCTVGTSPVRPKRPGRRSRGPGGRCCPRRPGRRT